MDHDFQNDLDVISSIKSIPGLLNTVCKLTRMNFAAIARVTPERWVCLAVDDRIGFGLKPGGELSVDTTICREVLNASSPIVIDHVAQDDLFRSHPTPAMYGFQSYISVPIVLSDGSFFGTLCSIDPNPARLKEKGIEETFKLFAELIAFQIDAASKARNAEDRLLDAYETAEMREQFIAVLGHDLRNPLAAIKAGMKLLKADVQNTRGSPILDLVQQSIDRMSALIDDIMDLAHSRLGGGIKVDRKPQDLAPILTLVVEELRLSHPMRAITFEADLERPAKVDAGRIARLLSNLIANALAYGKNETPVHVRASMDDNLIISVTNEGPEISHEIRQRLFKPFGRGTSENKQGLGLGLYICSQIARAHNGDIELVSDDTQTTFTFRMPIVSN